VDSFLKDFYRFIRAV